MFIPFVVGACPLIVSFATRTLDAGFNSHLITSLSHHLTLRKKENKIHH